MPLYDYQCDRCQTTFEVRASFREKELGLRPVCPNCKSTDTRQILTSGLFIRGESSGSASMQSSFCSPNSGAGCCG